MKTSYCQKGKNAYQDFTNLKRNFMKFKNFKPMWI